MPDLVAADVTYTIDHIEKHWGARALKRVYGKIAFGDGAKTYPTGGVPLALGQLGFTAGIVEFTITGIEGSAPLDWSWDRANPTKVRGYWPVGGAGGAPVAAATNPILNAGAVAVTASAATGPFAAGQGKEFVGATTTIPATTLSFAAEGW